MRKAMLAVLLLSAAVSGCTAQSQNQGASGADRQGRFDKSPLDLGTCATVGVHTVYPDMYIAIGGETADYSIVASRTKDGAAIWTMMFNDAGSNNSDVALHGSGASADELAKTWRIVEFCETYESG